jgi:pimeloyl-ACP methyl ester carboxylesterase
VNLVLALHGNPGSPDDFALLEARCEAQEVRIVAPALEWGPAGLEGLIVELDALVAREARTELAVVGYSWGAWLALHWVAETVHAPSVVVLVNPCVIPTNPVSPLTAAIVEAPGLGRVLLGLAAPRLARHHIRSVFAPAAPPDSIFAAWRERLQGADSWAAALRRKRGQQGRPWPRGAAPRAPVRVLVGAEDRVAPGAGQIRELRAAFPGLEVREVPGAGHSLPWTHAEEVLRCLEPQESA